MRVYNLDRSKRAYHVYALVDESVESVKNLLLNIKAYHGIYPGWGVWVFMKQNHWAVEILRSVGVTVGVEKGDYPSEFWPLYALAVEADYLLFRDVNNIVNKNERIMVDEWMASGNTVLCMGKRRLNRMGLKGGLYPDIRRRVGMYVSRCRENGAEAKIDAFLSVLMEPYQDSVYQCPHGVVKKVECSLWGVLFGTLDLSQV